MGWDKASGYCTSSRIGVWAVMPYGFPTFMTLTEELRDKGVGLAAIQTVSEGADVNTFDRLWENRRRYALRIPFGHAVPAIMEAYRSGGTPWFVVIAPDGRVVYDGFPLDPESLVQTLRPLAA
jgi:hypothetical protein